MEELYKDLQLDHWEMTAANAMLLYLHQLGGDEARKLVRSIVDVNMYSIEGSTAQTVQNVIDDAKLEEVIELPPDSWFITIPRKAYCGLVKMIPEGCISSEKAILDFIRSYLESKAPGCTESAALAVESYTVLEEHEPGYPSWRLVSKYGLLSSTDDGACLDEKQILREGLETESCGAGGKSKRVVDYKKHMVDWEQLFQIRS